MLEANKVAVVVGFSSIIAQKTHGVTLDNMLRMLSREVLHTIPQRWNRLHVLVQTQNKAILLSVIFHEPERVIVDVTVELNTRFHSPVPFELR